MTNNLSLFSKLFCFSFPLLPEGIYCKFQIEGKKQKWFIIIMLSNLILWRVLDCCSGTLNLVVSVIVGGQRRTPIFSWTVFWHLLLTPSSDLEGLEYKEPATSKVHTGQSALVDVTACKSAENKPKTNEIFAISDRQTKQNREITLFFVPGGCLISCWSMTYNAMQNS